MDYPLVLFKFPPGPYKCHHCSHFLMPSMEQDSEIISDTWKSCNLRSPIVITSLHCSLHYNSPHLPPMQTGSRNFFPRGNNTQFPARNHCFRRCSAIRLFLFTLCPLLFVSFLFVLRSMQEQGKLFSKLKVNSHRIRLLDLERIQGAHNIFWWYAAILNSLLCPPGKTRGNASNWDLSFALRTGPFTHLPPNLFFSEAVGITCFYLSPLCLFECVVLSNMS